MELNIWKEGGEGVLVCNRQLMTRDGVISWSSLAVLLFQVRIAWYILFHIIYNIIFIYLFY